ncbi:unnamed protein product [Cyprideis torosa]|uniref:Uncharacterized protein n=1 Tax=Cyprideis torosa TaxID=163714 RepID=A0A7R8WH52_9CRUS|nr:unnamed protein product [Cyprideis torosa]CAG0896159.1 unnamed protein product [Cyprideis torosa]
MDYGRPKTGSGNRQMSSEDSDGVRPFTGRSMAGGRPVSGTGSAFGMDDRPVTGSGRPVTGAGRPMTGAGGRPVAGASRPMTGASVLGMDDRPMTGAGRPVTGSGRPLTGAGPAFGLDDRPMTGAGRPMTGASSFGMDDRPMTGAGRPVTGSDVAHDRLSSSIGRPPSGFGPGGRPISGFGPSEEDFYGGRPKTGGRQALAPANPASRPMTHAGRFMAYENQDGGGSRPMTGASGRPMTRQSSGTASRLMSASGQRGLATGMARPGTGVGLAAQVSVPDRPITQQGLGGLKSSAGGRGPGRQVQDKSFFVGELRGKMADLSSEIGKMSRELEALEQEQKSYLIYDVRVKELAVEWNSLQGEMADYNMLLDKLNTDTEKAEVEAEVGELKLTECLFK